MKGKTLKLLYDLIWYFSHLLRYLWAEAVQHDKQNANREMTAAACCRCEATSGSYTEHKFDVFLIQIVDS